MRSAVWRLCEAGLVPNMLVHEVRSQEEVATAIDVVQGAAAVGVYGGRPPSIKLDAVAEPKAKGLGATEIAKELKMGRASVYRVIANAQPSGALSL
jgi:hypothetical protein